MGCFHSKETFFGRAHGYVVCRNFQTTGNVRCPTSRCPFYADDGKGMEKSRIGKCACTLSLDGIRQLRSAFGAIDAFCDNALGQTPDGGAAFYEAEDPFLPHRLTELT